MHTTETFILIPICWR